MDMLPDSKRESYQLKCNEAELVLANGLELPRGISRKQLVDSMFYSRKRNPIFTGHPLLKEKYDHIAEELLAFRRQIAPYLERAAENPQSFGVDIEWRITQREALKAFALRLRQGFQHLGFEIPTGVGKSMVIGAYLRAYIEVCKDNNILNDVEVILLTSRANLVTQLMGIPKRKKRHQERPRKPQEISQGEDFGDLYEIEHDLDFMVRGRPERSRFDEEDAFDGDDFEMGYLLGDEDNYDEDAEYVQELDGFELDLSDVDFEEEEEVFDEENTGDEGDDNAIQLGDVKKWLAPILPKGQMRLITGETSQSERQKDAALTVMTYQGFSTIKKSAIHRNRKVGMIFFDEAHRISPALREQLKDIFPGALRVGGSATMKGPPGSRPFEVFESVGNEDLATTQSFHEQLAYHASLQQVIDRKELKLVRCLQKGVDIDLSDVSQTSAGNLNQEELTRKMMYSIPILVQFIREAFNETYPVLDLAGTKPIVDRTYIVSVKRIELAQKLANICTKELGIEAEWTSGRDRKGTFEDKIKALSRRKFQMLFSAGKLGEGLDVTEVDGVMSLWPYNRSSSWVLKQLIGRGTRLHDGDRDCLVIEPIFQTGIHKLATTPDLFDVEETHPGVLLAPTKYREVELKIIDHLNRGIHTEYVWRKSLTDEERESAEEIGWKNQLVAEKKVVDKIPLIRSAKQFEKLLRRRFVRKKKGDVEPKKQKQSEEDWPKIGELSEQEVIEEAKRQLMQRGCSRKVLANMSVSDFTQMSFGPFDSGTSLYNRLMGTEVQILGQERFQELIAFLYPAEAIRTHMLANIDDATIQETLTAVRTHINHQTMKRAEELSSVRFSRASWRDMTEDESVVHAACDIAQNHDSLALQLLDATDKETFHLVARMVKIAKLVQKHFQE